MASLSKTTLDVSIHFNCGYCRVAIKDLSNEHKFNRRLLNVQSIEEKFRKLFVCFDLNEDLFVKPVPHPSLFDRRCTQVLNTFSKKWKSPAMRTRYLVHFSICNWEKLSATEKKKHSLSKCERCRQKNLELQSSFPGAVYDDDLCTKVSNMISVTTQKNKKAALQSVLNPLNNAFKAKFGENFTTTLTKCSPKETKVQKKRTPTDVREEKRKLCREIRDSMNEQLSASTPIAILAENQSIATYKRQRLSQYFELNEPKTKKSHSPSIQTWNTQGLVSEIESKTPGEKIVWQQVAEKHGITGANRGQIAKDYIVNNTSVDLTRYTYHSPLTPTRRRVSRKRLSGGEISCPAPPTSEKVKHEWEGMIKDGVLTLGVPCVPYNLTRLCINDGKLSRFTIPISGRKIPLQDIRKKWLLEHEQFMRLPTDDELSAYTHSELVKICQDLGISVNCGLVEDEENLRIGIKLATRQRCLGFWHDHATILGHGYLLVTVSIMYDSNVFIPDACQSFIEKPEIHILGLSSSSLDDQVGFIPDRYECLQELNEVIYSSKHVPVTDVARFFFGDHPAQNFERGTQLGGNYKCGSCGVKSTMVGDFAHATHLKWRSIADLQNLAISGRFGKQPEKLKPLQNLTLQELKQELSSRGQWDISRKKPELATSLIEILKGVQRVPTLLIGDPTQSLCFLSAYEILDTEPLHDIKGHLTNLFEELPFLVEGTARLEIQNLLDTSLQKDKINCADLRCLAIQCGLFFESKSAVGLNIKLLISTIVEISHLLYYGTENRNPKLVLRLYNLSWLHHELCIELFPKTKKITMTKMFGTYFHSLLVHAPLHNEIISMSSVNTEKQESLFGQARAAALGCSNRQPENVIKSVLLHLQSKSLIGKKNIEPAVSRVSKLAKSLPLFNGTSIPKYFIQSRTVSWQSHLERIATFLVHGKDVWWTESTTSVQFFDGNDHADHHKEGPKLLHFKNSNMSSVALRSQKAWKEIVDNEISIPATEIRVYSDTGELTSFWKPTFKYPIVNSTLDTSVDGSSCCSSTSHTDKSAPSNSSNNLTSSVQTIATNSTTIQPMNDDGSPANGTNSFEDTITKNTADNGLQSLHDVTSDANEDTTTINVDYLVSDNTSNLRFQYHTKLATLIAKLLGDSKELETLDTIRNRIKTQKSTARRSKSEIKRYEDLLAQFQTEILKT